MGRAPCYRRVQECPERDSNPCARDPWFASRRGYPAPWLPFPWRWRLWIVSHRYDLGVWFAVRLCRGNRYGGHTPEFPPDPPGGLCLCARTRRRLDFIPF